MMKYKPSQAYYKEFTTARFSSGAAYDATGTPVVTANKNGTDDAAFVLTAANIDTGRYKITGTVPAGYADGDIVNVTVAATVDGVAAKANVDTFLVVTSREADIYARVGAPAGASIAADLVAIDNFVDDLEGRLTATRAGYMDNLSGGAVALASVCTETRLAELDAANLIADVAAVKGDTANILADTGTDGVVVAAASKTGYSLTQSFPANFAALAITAGGLVDITQAAADKVWGTAARTLTSFETLVADVWGYTSRLLTAGTNIALAKGTGVTGFNDLALTNIEATTILAKEATLAHATYGLSALNTDIDAIKAKTDNLPEGFKKNTAFNNFMFLMVNATDNKTGKTGLTITATRSIDGAAFAACVNSAAEVGSGFYKINLATSDQNGDMITYKFDGGATANVRTITIKTSA